MPQHNVFPPEKKIIVVGCSDFSRLMKLYLEKDCKSRVFAFCVERTYKKQQEFAGLPVIALEDLPESHPPCSYKILNAIGYRQMMQLRQRLHYTFKQMGYEIMKYVHPSAVVHSEIPEGCIITENVGIGFRNQVGVGTIIFSDCVISHDAVIGDFCYFAPGAVCCGHVSVGPRCFIGANATLRNGISLAEATLIGAGVYMPHSVEEPNLGFKAPLPIKLTRPSETYL